MTGLAKWLTTQVDADATLADKVYGWWRAFGERGIADDSYAAILITDVDPDTREYILRNDPERALAEVAFKRAVLAAHQAEQPFPDEGPQCSRCTGTGLLGIIHSLRWPCPDIWAMAQIYKDRPGYAEVRLSDYP